MKSAAALLICVSVWSHGAVAFVAPSSSSIRGSLLRGASVPPEKTKKTAFWGLLTRDYLDERLKQSDERFVERLKQSFEDLDRSLNIKFSLAVLPVVVMWAHEHEKAAKVMAEAAIFDKKYQALTQTLSVLKDALQ